MKLNKIVELSLESQAKELKEKNKSVREIARILTDVSKQSITFNTVQRYFTAQARLHRDVIEKNEKLKVKVIELELDTVQARQELITEIRDLARQAKEDGDIRTAIQGLDKAVAALDSLDKRLGRFSVPEVQVNVQVNQQFNEFMKVILEEVDDVGRARIISKLKQAAIY
ncbi:hypothetical protein ANME2D_02345 [Candidatus Methanoperedens nitroreducens]|uniref:Uncharacterized protein n=1 Tax=Candidatus Methanoperedens nitratireducens TaxID=1392998 RepID=A0A062V899_9EURY|nr:hypothetical protein [Candidatus Methanoperedens nitroreducens]KCZ71610.1 hypothetical protein ANME2D_02345 [Candidatus Methanoperedens nitroreducens]MDJ1421241.1 hypothetical protein [Candidatus Methanoperedens sp.]